MISDGSTSCVLSTFLAGPISEDYLVRLETAKHAAAVIIRTKRFPNKILYKVNSRLFCHPRGDGELFPFSGELVLRYVCFPVQCWQPTTVFRAAYTPQQSQVAPPPRMHYLIRSG